MFEFVAFDVETTGFSPVSDAIIEIGAARFVKGVVAETFNLLIDPRRPIPPEATRVHGITNAMVKGQQALESALEQFTEFCGSAVLLAHNAPFDVKFISAAGMAEHTPLPPGMVLDTLSISKQTLPDLFNYKLESLVKHFSIPQEGFHRASQDATCCGSVFVQLLKAMKNNGTRLKFENLINLSGGEMHFPHIEPKAKQINLFG